MWDVRPASSGPCVRPAMNSAHFSGVSAGSASKTKTWTTSQVDETSGLPARRWLLAQPDRHAPTLPGRGTTARRHAAPAACGALVAAAAPPRREREEVPREERQASGTPPAPYKPGLRERKVRITGPSSDSRTGARDAGATSPKRSKFERNICASSFGPGVVRRRARPGQARVEQARLHSRDRYGNLEAEHGIGPILDAGKAARREPRGSSARVAEIGIR